MRPEPVPAHRVSGPTDAVALQYGVSLDKLADKLEQTRFEPDGITANADIPFAISLLDYVFRWMRCISAPRPR